MCIKSTTETKVSKIIGQLKTNSDSGYDLIKCKTIIKLKHIIIPYRYYFFSLSLLVLNILRVRVKSSIANSFKKIRQNSTIKTAQNYLNCTNFFENGFLEKKGTQPRLVQSTTGSLNSNLYVRVLF